VQIGVNMKMSNKQKKKPPEDVLYELQKTVADRRTYSLYRSVSGKTPHLFFNKYNSERIRIFDKCGINVK